MDKYIVADLGASLDSQLPAKGIFSKSHGMREGLELWLSCAIGRAQDFRLETQQALYALTGINFQPPSLPSSRQLDLSNDGSPPIDEDLESLDLRDAVEIVLQAPGNPTPLRPRINAAASALKAISIELVEVADRLKSLSVRIL